MAEAYHDLEANVAKNPDDPLHNKFLARVLGVVAIQLLATGLISVGLYSIPSFKTFVIENNWFHWVLLGVLLATMFTFYCCRPKSREANLGLLGLLTVAMSLMVASFTVFYDLVAILIAVGLTSVAVGGLGVFALFTKKRLRTLSIVAFIGSIAILPLFIFMLIWPSIWLRLLVSAICFTLFSICLIIDIKRVRDHDYSEDEWAVAALDIYIDVVYMFLHLLRIVGMASD